MFKLIFSYFKGTSDTTDYAITVENVILKILKDKPMVDPLNQLPLDNTLGKNIDGKYYKACFRATLDKIQKEIPLQSLEIIKVYSHDDISVRFLISEYKERFNSNLLGLYPILENISNKLEHVSKQDKSILNNQYAETIIVIKEAFKDLHKLGNEDLLNISVILNQILEDIEIFNSDEMKSISNKLKFEAEYVTKIKQTREEMKSFELEFC